MAILGLLPRSISSISNIVAQTYKGHVTIVPSPTLNDYRNILTDVKIEDYWPSYQAVYVQSLRKIAHIRSYFGIEREFDRYYHLLKSQLRDGTNFDEMREEDVL